MKYSKIQTADAYPVSVPQIRQLRRNIDWARNCRLNAIGIYGRLATDALSVSDGSIIFLPEQHVDLSFYDRLHVGLILDGSGTATWQISISMTGGTEEISITSTNPGSSEAVSGRCSLPYGHPRICTPRIAFTRVSGSGTLAVRFVGFWLERTIVDDYGPQNLQPATAADLQSIMGAAERLMEVTPCLLGWIGGYMIPVSSTTALRWYALGDKNDDDTTTESIMDGRALVYQSHANATKYFTLTHAQNLGASPTVRHLPDSASGIYTPIDLPVVASSYDTATPWSGGKLDASAGADSIRPYLTAFGVHRRMTLSTLLALQPAVSPVMGRQIRTVEASGAVGVNDIAEYVHQMTWAQGGNCSGGMAQTAGKAFTISTSLVTVFDGLIWVHDDAQSGATWGSNTYQVALRLSNGGASVDMSVQLTVDGNSVKPAAVTVGAGEQYVLIDCPITGIDTDGYAVPVKVELVNSASRTITIYSVQISRRGAAY